MNDNVANQGKLSACLTASELVSLRKSANSDEFPYIIGQKCYSRNDTWLEEKAVECVLENQNETLNQKIASRISDLIEAEWDTALNVAVTSKLKGKYVQHMGHVVEKKIHLSPEESVFLLQNRSIEILHKKAPMSMEEAYAVILKKNLSFEKYQVYSHLAQLGYIVVQHEPKLHSIRKDNLNRSKKRKHKRNASTSLEDEPKEKRSTSSAIFYKETDISNEPCLTQDNSAISNNSHNTKNIETAVEISESNESTALDVNNELGGRLSPTVQLTCDEEKNHSDVNNLQDSACISETPSLSDTPENVSDALITQKLNDNTQKKMGNESSNSTNFRDSDKSEHGKEQETLVSFKNFASFECFQPFENKNNNATNAVVENTVSNDCTILAAANTVDVGEGRSDLTLSEHFKPLVSSTSKNNSAKLSDISNDLEEIKKKHVPEEKFQDDYVVEVNDKSRDDASSDEDSIEVANHSESDIECDVMTCSSEEDNSVDVYGGMSDIPSVREELCDDDITLVEVKKKEKTPLAVIDIMSDEEQAERMSVGDVSDDDDEIQIVKVCAGSSKNPVSSRNSYQTLNSVKKEQKFNIKGNRKMLSSRRRVVFPDLFRKDVVCLSRPQPNLLPNNVKPAKEAYVLNIKKEPSHSEKQSSKRLWNSYKDLQEYQRGRYRNRNSDSGNWVYPRQENRQYHDNWNDAGHRFQNNFHESQSLPERLPILPEREFPGNHQRSNFNLGPLNMVPGMTGNIMVDLHRAAYSFANNMLTNMMNQNVMNQNMMNQNVMNQSMMSNMPQYNSFQSSRYRGNYTNLESNLSNTQSSFLSYDSYLNNVKPSGSVDYGHGSSQQNDFPSPFNPLMNSVPNYPMGRDSPLNFNRNRDFPPRNFAHRGRPFPCVYRNVYNKKSWTEVKAIVERHKDVNDHNSDIEEVPIDVNEVLWNSELHPLVKPGTNHQIEDVLKSLQKTKIDSLFHERNDRFLPSANQFLQISFDVYLPGFNFKKTCPDIPKYRMVVVRAADPIPKFSEIVLLQKKWNDGAILQLAVVDNGEISFYSFNSVQLPHLIPHDVRRPNR